MPVSRLQKCFFVFKSLLLFGAAILIGCQPAYADYAKVKRVIDGDTIELADGRKVRYIGIDTPEVRKHVGDRWIEDPQPFGREASAFNRRLVEGKTVRLAYDVQTHDRYGRWLAYVYVEDADKNEIFVNAELLKQGMAQTLTIPPNVKYADSFRGYVRQARQAKRGLWSAP